jgi:hypothetical protein
MNNNHNEETSGNRPLWTAAALSVLMLALGLGVMDAVTAPMALNRLLLPLLRLLVFITIGLVAGQIIEAAGWTVKLGSLGAPMFRFARLGPQCSAAFSTAFISGAAANAMLYDFWKDGRINRHQLILTNLANQLPAFFLHLPTTVFIVLPLTGRAGGLYFLLTFVAALFRLSLVLVWGRWRLAEGAYKMAMPDHPRQRIKKKTALRDIIRQKLPRRLKHVATFVVPIYIAVFLVNSAGLFEWARLWFARWVVTSVVPVEALSLVALSFAAEFTSGFAAAGALLQEGVLTVKQAVLALLIGNIVAFPIRALRHQLPRLMGIFAPKLGLQILLLGQGFRISSLVLVGALYYMLS